MHIHPIEKGAIVVDTHDIIFDINNTNVISVEKYIVLTKKPEPAVHNVSLMITDEKWLNNKVNHDALIRILKNSYNGNLVALLDMDGNKITC